MAGIRRRSDAVSLAVNVVMLPTIVNPVKFAPLLTAGLTLGDTIHNWDTADNPTALPEIKEPLPGAAERVLMPVVLQGK